MKSKSAFLALMVGASLIVLSSCSNGNEKSSNAVIELDSAGMAEKARDEQTLSTLEGKKVTAEQNAKEAISDTKEAKRIERDAVDAAEQADDAFKTEKKAQESRQQADDQAERADNASSKANEN